MWLRVRLVPLPRCFGRASFDPGNDAIQFIGCELAGMPALLLHLYEHTLVGITGNNRRAVIAALQSIRIRLK